MSDAAAAVRTASAAIPPPARITALQYQTPAAAEATSANVSRRRVLDASGSGLTADRVFWLQRAVRVDRQLVTRGGPPRFAPPKTESSNRTVPASAWVLDRLGEHVGQRHDGYVLHREDQAVTHGMFHHAWRTTVVAAGLGDYVTDPKMKRRRFVGPKYHALRHAFASMLISAGCSVKAVQHALGHSEAATTLNLYSHLWPGDEDRIRQAVDAALGDPVEDQVRTAGVAH